jgi:hypothetical protein
VTSLLPHEGEDDVESDHFEQIDENNDHNEVKPNENENE